MKRFYQVYEHINTGVSGIDTLECENSIVNEVCNEICNGMINGRREERESRRDIMKRKKRRVYGLKCGIDVSNTLHATPEKERKEAAAVAAVTEKYCVETTQYNVAEYGLFGI